MDNTVKCVLGATAFILLTRPLFLPVMAGSPSVTIRLTLSKGDPCFLKKSSSFPKLTSPVVLSSSGSNASSSSRKDFSVAMFLWLLETCMLRVVVTPQIIFFSNSNCFTANEAYRCWIFTSWHDECVLVTLFIIKEAVLHINFMYHGLWECHIACVKSILEAFSFH